MQRRDKKQDYKVEFYNSSNGDLEIRYFDTPQDSSYLSWKLPRRIVKDLISWWRKLRKNKNIHFPIKENTKVCEFNMYTEKPIEYKRI